MTKVADTPPPPHIHTHTHTHTHTHIYISVGIVELVDSIYRGRTDMQ